MKSDYKIHAESLVRMFPDSYMEQIEKLINECKPEDIEKNVRTGTEVLEEQLSKNYYIEVKKELPLDLNKNLL